MRRFEFVLESNRFEIVKGFSFSPSRLELLPPHAWPRQPVGMLHGTMVV
jgi:hypothetical protein